MALELPDARSLSPETLEALRVRAIHAVEELGLAQKQVAQILGVSPEVVNRWCAAYRQAGVEALEARRRGRALGSGRALSEQQGKEIRQTLQTRTPRACGLGWANWSRAAVAELIDQRYGLSLTVQAVGVYLRRWGFTPQKPARQAREQDEDEVREFVEETLPQVVERAKTEEGELHFSDEVGVRVGDQIGASYAPKGQTPVLAVPKTHLEQNVISSVTPEGRLHYWLFPGTLNSQKFITFLDQLIAHSARKIYLFIDRHPAHEAARVEQWLAEHPEQIEIVWLPRYAPECNPDEFLNNDLKQQLKQTPLPATQPELQDLIQNILDPIADIPERIKGYFTQADIPCLVS
jgi:transposase